MKHSLSVLALVVLLSACSSSTTTTAEKEPPPPPQPMTGRQALQTTFPVARGWAADALPVRIQNYNLQDVPSADGKAGAWEITYTSTSMRSSRAFVWSSVEAQGLNKGVYGGSASSWTPGGREVQFQATYLGVDTPEILETASENATEYLETEGDKPPVTFLLEMDPRFPAPVWRVMWGNSVGSAEYSAFVNATDGSYLGR